MRCNSDQVVLQTTTPLRLLVINSPTNHKCMGCKQGTSSAKHAAPRHEELWQKKHKHIMMKGGCPSSPQALCSAIVKWIKQLYVRALFAAFAKHTVIPLHCCNCFLRNFSGSSNNSSTPTYTRHRASPTNPGHHKHAHRSGQHCCSHHHVCRVHAQNTERFMNACVVHTQRGLRGVKTIQRGSNACLQILKGV